jgi:uncharacterized repeat protein (TIGR01451 family)
MEDRYVLVAGLLLCLAGSLLLLVPGLGTAGLPGLLVTLAVVGVAFVGLVGAAGYLTNPRGETVRLPTPERRPRYRRVGATLRETLESVDRVGRRALTDDLPAVEDADLPRARLRTELHERAVTVLMRTSGCNREAAVEQLAAGTWTDDPDAAAFFAETLTPPLSWRQRIPGLPSPPLPLIRRGRRAIAELVETAGLGSVDVESRASPPSPETGYWPTASLPTTRTTGRVRWALVGVLVVSAVGVLFGVAGFVLVATMGIALVAAARAFSPTTSLTLTRTLSDDAVAPGDEVTVTVTVRNDGDRTLTDCRLLDGVPAGLTVVEGSPRFATALRPGKTATIEYTVEVVPGTHRFERALAVTSDPLGATEQVEAVAVDGDGELTAGFDPEQATAEALASQVSVHAGVVEGDASGAGVEFDTVRAYRRGDPPGRIDWRQRAKTGELSTVEFREPRQPRVLLLVDARPAAYVAAPGGELPGPRHSALAAATFGAGLLAAGVPVGLATVGTDCWLPPAGGTEQRLQLREMLAGAGAVPWTPPTDSRGVDVALETLDARLSPDTQLVVFTPLADEGSVALCRQLDASGHAVTVVSPDCTATATVSDAYGRLTRWDRCLELRSAGITVHDWQPAAPLTEVFARGD